MFFLTLEGPSLQGQGATFDRPQDIETSKIEGYILTLEGAPSSHASRSGGVRLSSEVMPMADRPLTGGYRNVE